MAEYYLISQLPSLDGVEDNTPLPITEERLFELCNCYFSTKLQNELKLLTLIPPKNYKKSSSAVVNSWNEGERNLRLALGKVRAEKLKKTFDIGNCVLSTHILQTARTAVENESPMDAEVFLNNYRLSFLETLRPMDIFSEDYVFYYALKLKLLLRMRRFNTANGKAAYKNIYDSVVNGEVLEAIQ